MCAPQEATLEPRPHSHSLSHQPQLHTTLPPLPFKVSLEALEGVCAWFGGGAGEVRGHPDKRAREKS